MKSKLLFTTWLAALALLVSGCGLIGGGDGGGAEPETTPLAFDDVPVPPAPAVDTDDSSADGDDPDAAPAPDLTALPDDLTGGYDYASNAVRAATMTLLPEDLGDDGADLAPDGLLTGEVDNLSDVVYAYDKEARAALLGKHGRRTGYRTTLVRHSTAEAPRPTGQAVLLGEGEPPRVEVIRTEVALFRGDDEAAARLADERAQWQAVLDRLGRASGIERIESVATLPGAAFVVERMDGDGDTGATIYYFSRQDTVASVSVAGVRVSEDALHVAEHMVARVWQVQTGQVPPRDPAADAAGFDIPHTALDQFRAVGETVISDGDGKIYERYRGEATYGGPDTYSCQLTRYRPGEELLLSDVVVDGNSAWIWSYDDFGTVELDTRSAEFAAAAAWCPSNEAHWRNDVALAIERFEAAEGHTQAGLATSYRAAGQDHLDRVFAWELTSDKELERFVRYVDDDGWLVAQHADVWYPRGVAEDLFGGSYQGSRVLVEESLRIVDPNGDELVVPDRFGVSSSRRIDVGETVDF